MGCSLSWNQVSKVGIDSDEIALRFSGKNIFIFGAGKSGRQFLKRFSDCMNIVGIIDNNVTENNFDNLEGIPLVSFFKFQQIRNDEPIILSSLIYADEMGKQLMAHGYTLNKDFYIWNPTLLEQEEYAERFIAHNHAVWGKPIPKADGIILLRHYTWHESIFIDWSYFINCLAEKYKAEIWTYDNKTAFYDNTLNRIYQSINVKGIICTDTSREQAQRAQKIYSEIWPTLHTKNDWLSIKVEGYDFGEDICSYYIRHHSDEIVEDLSTLKFSLYLLKMLNLIVFWLDYFRENRNIKAIVLGDGFYTDGIIRKIAVHYNISVYAISPDQKIKWNHYSPGESFKYYKIFFNELSKSEREYGIKLAKEKLKLRLNGDTSDISYMSRSAYGESCCSNISLKKNGKIKVMICPHAFGDNPYGYGKFLFPDHWEWLCYLGELSKTTDYDWYLKIHPMAEENDWKLLKEFIKRFPNIEMLPQDVSPLQLQKEGMRFALTVWGTIGHEYPAIGIHVINAGPNPHMAFEFNWHPKTIEEYRDLLLNLDTLDKTINMEEIYQFYCIHYFFFNRLDREKYDICYKSHKFIEKVLSLKGRTDTQRYSDFLQEWNIEQHHEIMESVERWMNEIDAYRDGIFMRRT